MKEDGLSVCGAARRYAVPETTLRDRVAGRISIDITTTGHPPLFDQEEEALMVDHIKRMAEIGYGYTRAEVLQLANDYAHDTGKKAQDCKISNGWYYHFLNRWPELHAVKPASLSELRAKAASQESISNYFTELESILIKYNLKNKPEYIYNVDEKGINTGGGKPPNIIAARNKKAQVVASERAQTVTVLGCGSASGALIPPYLVFPGKRMLPELLKGSTPGCDGTVSMTGTGYSNTEIFTNYVKHHFLRFIPNRDPNQPLLLLYDGHKSHISISLIQWAREHNIILFVLPPHCSHILQPMDVGCFSPFETLYQQETHRFMRQFSGQSITRYDVCALVCNVYEHALSPSNLRSSFKKTGIYPFCSAVVDESLTAPSLSYIGKAVIQDKEEGLMPDCTGDCRMNQETTSSDGNGKEQTAESCAKFLEKRGGDVLLQVKVAKKPRKSIHKVVGGKPITEDNVFMNVQEYVSEQSSKSKGKTSVSSKSKGKTSVSKASTLSKVSAASKSRKDPVKKSNITKSIAEPEPVPGTSGLSNKANPEIEDNSDSDIDVYESESCCVCKKWEPEALKSKPYIELVQWADCACGHWVHLRYCVPERVVRRGDIFKCPHCRV